MSFRTAVTALGALFIVLLAALVFGAVFAPASASKRAADAALFPGLRPSLVRQIEISDATTRIVGTKAAGQDAAGGGWTLDIAGVPYPASQARADSFVNDMAALARGTLVTRDAASLASLGLGAAAGKRVVLRGSGSEVLAELHAGSAATGSQGMYVQPAGHNEAYLTGAALSGAVTTDRTYWAEMRILPSTVTGDSIIRLSVAQKGTLAFSWTATRERSAQNVNAWVIEGKTSVKIQQDKLSSVASSVAGISGGDFLLDSHLAPDESTAQAVINLTGSDNRSYTLLFGARQADARYPCVLVGTPVPWLVPEWRYQEILKSEKAFTTGSP